MDSRLHDNSRYSGNTAYFCVMKREIRHTEDGSTTLYIPDLDETYHSTHGAIQEAIHVFIENGLKQVEARPVNVFEMGFGTGLNALLTYAFSEGNDVPVNYTGIEAYPVSVEMIDDLNYVEKIDSDLWIAFDQMHNCEWGKSHGLQENFSFKKIHEKIENYSLDRGQYDIIYFDAFGPRAQGEMWSPEILSKMYDGLKKGGMLVTYCAQGQFKRNLKALGFEVKSLPGPPGKREMTVALK